MDAKQIRAYIDELNLPPAPPELSHYHAYQMLLLLVRWHQVLEQIDAEQARALRLIVSKQTTSNNWYWMAQKIEDYELADALMRIQAQYNMDVNRGRYNVTRFRKGASPAAMVLDRVSAAFILHNPLMEDLASLYEILSEVSKRINYIPKSENSFRIMRSQLRRRNVDAATRLRGYDPTNQRFILLGKRELKSKLPPIDITGKEYYETAECQRYSHQLDPLYRFHAQAWGLRCYAAALTEAGYEECPFFGRDTYAPLSLEMIEFMNKPSQTHDYCRYLIEAERYIERRKLETMTRRRTLSDKQYAMYLNCYYNILLPSGKELILVAPVTQKLPGRVIKLMRTEEERRAAYAHGRYAISENATPCNIGQLIEYIARAKLNSPWATDDDLPRLPSAKRSRVAAPSRTLPRAYDDPTLDPERNPDLGLLDDFTPSRQNREAVKAFLAELDDPDNPTDPNAPFIWKDRLGARPPTQPTPQPSNIQLLDQPTDQQAGNKSYEDFLADKDYEDYKKWAEDDDDPNLGDTNE